MDIDAIKGQAIAGISAFNARQTHSTDEIAYVSPINMTVVDENRVAFETTRLLAATDRVLISCYRTDEPHFTALTTCKTSPDLGHAGCLRFWLNGELETFALLIRTGHRRRRVRIDKHYRRCCEQH